MKKNKVIDIDDLPSIDEAFPWFYLGD